MASTYTRPDSPFIFIRYKDPSGKWRGRKTGFLKTKQRDIKDAEEMAADTTTEEKKRTPAGKSPIFSDWVVPWLEDRYRGRETTTLAVYLRHWKKLSRWLEARGLMDPRQLSYKHALEYRDFRKVPVVFKGKAKDAGTNNTILHELKFLSIVMQEAVRREFASGNPFMRLGLRKDKAKEKSPWSDEEIQTVAAAIGGQSHFIRATFLLGLYQAARLRQCAVPLSDIDLKGKRITYRRTKGDKPFTQPIDARCIDPLTALIAERKSGGHTTLCDIPVLPSVEWRRFLDSLNLPHLVHHGLRVTWITRAALSRGAVSQPEAKRFVNHGSTSVHELYQKLNAEDLAHVPAAMNLPTLEPPAVSRPTPDNAPGSSSAGSDT